MADISIVNENGSWKSILFIDGDFQKDVRAFSITWGFNEFPIMKVDRWKPDKDGRPFTIGGGYVAELTEYYPIHSLKVLNR